MIGCSSLFFIASKIKSGVGKSMSATQKGKMSVPRYLSHFLLPVSKRLIVLSKYVLLYCIIGLRL